MNDVVTMTVKQAQVVEGVVGMVAIPLTSSAQAVVVDLQHVLCREAQSTSCDTPIGGPKKGEDDGQSRERRIVF